MSGYSGISSSTLFPSGNITYKYVSPASTGVLFISIILINFHLSLLNYHQINPKVQIQSASSVLTNIMSTPALPSFTKKWHSTAYEALDTSLPSLSAAGKNIVITGGGSGIGAATALRFAQAGASSISILGRRADILESTRSVIESSVPSAKVLTYSVDVMQKSSVDAAFTAIHAAVGKIHVFVNNAGYLPAKSSILEAETEDWWLAFQINILGAFHATQAFLKFKAAESTLVNVSSAISYVLFVEGTSSYGASKEAGVRFFASVQVENPEVRVVNIQPGTVHTDMAQKSGYPSSDDGKAVQVPRIISKSRFANYSAQ
jgi:NAD(P)-dependent dehydrogenase (short-subunit alcohol dehydrogenase family)